MPSPRQRASRVVKRAPRPLWTCPRCAVQLVVANSYHACGRFNLDDLFRHAEPHVRPLFDQFQTMVRAAGDSKLIPQKSRAVFMARIRFINIQVRRSHLIVGFVRRRRPAHRRFLKVESFSPRSHVAYVRFYSPMDLDDEVRGWIAAAYEAGVQEGRRAGGPTPEG